MAEVHKLPLTGDAQLNVEEESLHTGAPSLIDAYTDETGATIQRPGLSLICDLGTSQPVEGLFWWERKGWLIAVSDGRIWKITASDGTRSELSSGGTKLRQASATGGIGRVSFVDDGTYLLMANGAGIIYSNGTAATAQIADGDAPTTVSFLGYLDGYLLANEDGTGRFWWSDNLNSLSWASTSYATAEGSPDELIALGVGWREILLLGEQSVETWFNDGTNPFSRLEGAWTEGGSESPHSLIFVGDGAWTFLDKKHRLVTVSGRQTREVSGAARKWFQNRTITSDCLAMAIEVKGRKFMVLTFPTDDKTIVVDAKGDPQQGWAEWASWSGSAYSRWVGHTHAYARGWGMNIVGDKSTGKIYEMHEDYADDNGSAIRALRRTPHINHGTDLKKRSNWMRIRVRRDLYNANVTTPVLKVRHQDNNSGTWSDWKSLDMGASGDTEFFVTMRRLGMYRTRQWEFCQDERCGLTLIEAEEEVEVLHR